MSNPLPAKLDLNQDCPLLEEEHRPLVDSFNLIIDSLQDAGGIFEWIESYLDPGDASGLGSRPARKGLRDRLKETRQELASKKYRVGVAGRFQVGKTSSINTTLKHQLLSEGKTGASCTSVVTIVALSPTPRTPAYQVHYFELEEIRRRFEGIAAKQKFKNCPVSQLPEPGDALTAVTQLENWVKNVDNENKDDAMFLLAFLSDYASGFNLLGSVLKEIECDDEEHLEQNLSQLVTYGADDTHGLEASVSNPLLIKHVKVLIHLPDLNPTLELVDLPGLGTARTYDSTLTSSYIRELHGLLLFVEPRRQNAGELREIVQSFRHSHEEISGRRRPTARAIFRYPLKNLTNHQYQTASGSFFEQLL